MSKTGIQLKWDHPNVAPLLHTFGAAYGIKHETVLAMAQAGELCIRMEPTGIWIELVSDLTVEEAGRALQALGRMTRGSE